MKKRIILLHFFLSISLIYTNPLISAAHQSAIRSWSFKSFYTTCKDSFYVGLCVGSIVLPVGYMIVYKLYKLFFKELRLKELCPETVKSLLKKKKDLLFSHARIVSVSHGSILHNQMSCGAYHNHLRRSLFYPRGRYYTVPKEELEVFASISTSMTDNTFILKELKFDYKGSKKAGYCSDGPRDGYYIVARRDSPIKIFNIKMKQDDLIALSMICKEIYNIKQTIELLKRARGLKSTNYISACIISKCDDCSACIATSKCNGCCAGYSEILEVVTLCKEKFEFTHFPVISLGYRKTSSDFSEEEDD